MKLISITHQFYFDPSSAATGPLSAQLIQVNYRPREGLWEYLGKVAVNGKEIAVYMVPEDPTVAVSERIISMALHKDRFERGNEPG